MGIFVLPPSTSANAKGDVFTDRCIDIAQSLGYDAQQVNSPRAGREVDILARHRAEDRWALFECKNELARSGGADINKFVGVLSAESQRYTPIEGYFVSVSGFTSTAIEQETALPQKRCILLAADEVQRHLVEGRYLCVAEAAVAASGQYFSENVRADRGLDVVATEFGWAWIVYGVDANERRTEYCLIRADETGPGARVREAVSARLSQRTEFQTLICVGSTDALEVVDRCAELYSRYLDTEYAHVSHDGLPADPTVQTTVALSDLYVPQLIAKYEEHILVDEVYQPIRYRAVGTVLNYSPRIAVLGDPGMGKSTLVRRLALAASKDEAVFLEEQGFDSGVSLQFILVNCRDVRPGADTIHDLLRDIPRRAGRPDLCDEFLKFALDSLEDHSSILVVDGLDEISRDRDRLTFVRHLNQFVATYPSLSMIVTSRKPGFRAVAGSLSRILDMYAIADLEDQDIIELVHQWFALIPRRSGVTRQPEELAAEILSNSSLRQLASTPLLLTTLLLVERWLGDLPKRRVTLYEKAIEVLLISWNVEGHEPLNFDEVLPQLGFVAHEMSVNGVKRLASSQLYALLARARQAMPDILGYASSGPRELLKAVESRSSIIVSAGYVDHGSELQEAFEFKHLTFQEYLCAKALASSWTFEGRAQSATEHLSGHFDEASWVEIVPLAAVLAGREAGQIVEALCDVVQAHVENGDLFIEPESDDAGISNLRPPVVMLSLCLRDEVSISPELARRAMDLLFAAQLDSDTCEVSYQDICNTRFYAIVEDAARDAFANHERGAWLLEAAGPVVAKIVSEARDDLRLPLIEDWNRESRFFELCGLMYVAMMVKYSQSQSNEVSVVDGTSEPWCRLEEWAVPLAFELIESEDEWIVWAASAWFLCWFFAVEPCANVSAVDVQRVVDRCQYATRSLVDGHFAFWLLTRLAPRGFGDITVVSVENELEWLRGQRGVDQEHSEAIREYASLLLVTISRRETLRESIFEDLAHWQSLRRLERAEARESIYQYLFGDLTGA